ACLLVFPMTMSTAFAGNSLKNLCRGSFSTNVTIKKMNIIQNWLNRGPGLNILLSDSPDWHGLFLGQDKNDDEMYENGKDGFLQIASIAYVSKSKVNVCHGSGMLNGIEIIQSDF
ncbi:hypothetical protein, partial [Shewanella sp. MBTL60-112-B2]